MNTRSNIAQFPSRTLRSSSAAAALEREMRVSVSAVLPTWNRRHCIVRAIDSILAQTLPLDEILVIDDGSSDGTSAMLRECFADRVRVIEQPNTGVGGALYRGIREARSEWIAIHNSDDEWTPDRNRQFVEAAERVPEEVAWIFGDTQVVTDEGASGRTLFMQHRLNVPQPFAVFEMPLATQYPIQVSFLQSSFIRSSVLRELNCFSESLRSSEDVLAGFQVGCKYWFAAVPDVVTRLYRTSDLKESSLDFLSRASPDYFRARIQAFSTARQAGKPGPWAEKHADAVRGLCKVLLEQGGDVRRLALEQFRFEVSAKSALFLIMSLAGHSGYRFWKFLSSFRNNSAPVVLWNEVEQ